MNKIKQAIKLLQDSGIFEPSQLHEGKDRLWITPYGNIINFKQLELAMAAAELYHLLPMLYKDYENCRLDLISYYEKKD